MLATTNLKKDIDQIIHLQASSCDFGLEILKSIRHLAACFHLLVFLQKHVCDHVCLLITIFWHLSIFLPSNVILQLPFDSVPCVFK